jgi:hypothetical protein
MKGFVDAMATVGTPLPDDELIDYIIAGLGTPFAPLQASLTVFANANPDAVLNLSDFYAMLLSYEAMQEQNSQAAVEYSSSANAAGRRGDYGRGGGRPYDNSGRSGGRQGNGQQGGGYNGHPGGGGFQGQGGQQG